MKRFLLALGFLFPLAHQSVAQRVCLSHAYLEQELEKDGGLVGRMALIESLSADAPVILNGSSGHAAVPAVYKIPVVVHILYNEGSPAVTDEQVHSQIEALNRDFRKRNGDTVNTPLAFRELAADAGIEFALATTDPQGRATTGILRKKTSIRFFSIDDRIKSSAHGGQDGWDAGQYLNIWVGSLAGGLLGYASPVGGAPENDGVVIHDAAFGTTGAARAPYNKGRTTTHEVGHWLGLRHIWGDMYCGDDYVADTPPQRSSSQGCPNGVISTCDNGQNGNMYMNFMDFTDDACTNLFTRGQVSRMRKLFMAGGPRAALLFSKGLSEDPLPAIELPEAGDAGLAVRLYPNPVPDLLTVEGGGSLLGKQLAVHDHTGRLVYQSRIGKGLLQLNVHNWQAGIYFLKVEGCPAMKFIKAH